MKILVSLYCIKEIGGISTSAYNLLHEISGRYDVSLCVLSNYVGSSFVLPEQIKIVNGSDKLGMATILRSLLDKQNILKKVIRNYYRLVRRIRKEQFIYNCINSISVPEEYDAALAFTDLTFPTKNGFDFYDYYFVLNRVKAKRKIAWIHNNPSYLGYKHDDCDRFFKDFDGVVNVSYDCKKIFDSIIPEYSKKSFVVYNMYNINEIAKKASANVISHPEGKVHLVTVARISNQQKRIDRIVNVCRKLINEGLNQFEWIIVGDGEDRQSLQNIVDNEHMDTVVKFVGLKKNPYPYMKAADAFVLSSLYEGLPMTVKEAQILGCPAFTTSFGAATEAIKDKENGEICENSEEGLYLMIKSIILNPQKLKTYRDYLVKNPITNEVALSQLKQVVLG